MKKIIKQLQANSGFTLIEMMIVLVIISILLLIVVPNLTKNQEIANEKGCDATIELLNAQLIAYQVEKNELPDTLEDLITEQYVKSISCPDGSVLIMDGDEVVKDND